jgi:hypothetical protein
MLRGKPTGSNVTVSKTAIADPEAEGFRKTVGIRTAAAPEKTEDWRIKLKGGGCLHVQDSGDDWVAHRDVTDPRDSLLGHALDDMPVMTVGGAALVGLMVAGGMGALAAGSLAAILAMGRDAVRREDEFHAFLSAPTATYEETEKPAEVATPTPEVEKPEAPKAETPPAPLMLTEGAVAEVIDIEEARRARDAQPADKAG